MEKIECNEMIKKCIKQHIRDYGNCNFTNSYKDLRYCSLVLDTDCGSQGKELDIEGLYEGRKKNYLFRECLLNI